MNKIKRIVISVMVALGFVTPALVPAMAGAQEINSNLCKGASFNFEIDETDGCDTEDVRDAGTNVDEIIKTVINILSIVVGVVSVIMIIIGGFRYVTSSGDSGNVTSAKNTILYAVVGLVIVAFAQIIVQFVVGQVAGEG